MSVSHGGINALVGIGISASLLPPLVNGGLCFAFSAAGVDFSDSNDRCDRLSFLQVRVCIALA